MTRKKITKEAVENWLESHGLLEGYNRNRKEQCGPSIEFLINEVTNDWYPPHHIISGAFIWKETPCGHDVWKDVADRFEKWVDALPELQKKVSQEKRILHHLEEGHTLTALEALDAFGTMRLSAVIFQLKRQGYPIVTEIVPTSSGKRVARYSLINTK